MGWKYVYGETARRKTVRVYSNGDGVFKIVRSRWNEWTGEVSSSSVAYFSAQDPDSEFSTLDEMPRRNNGSA